MDKDKTLQQARNLRRDDRLEKSQELLLELLAEYPEDAQVLFEVGGSYDVMGEEPEAIPYYRQAIENGLVGSELQECLVCLGSSYRYAGQFEEAVEILEQAVVEFPDQNSARAFLALAYYSNDQYDQAVSLLLELLLDTSQDEDIQAYGGALDYYKDNLDEIWDDNQ